MCKCFLLVVALAAVLSSALRIESPEDRGRDDESPHPAYWDVHEGMLMAKRLHRGEVSADQMARDFQFAAKHDDLTAAASNLDVAGFPDRIGERAKVVSAQLHFKIGIFDIHPADIALYLDGNSSLWNRTNTIEDVMSAGSGFTIQYKDTLEIPQLALKMLMPMKSLTSVLENKLKDGLMPRARYSNVSEADVQKFFDMQFSEGLPSVGRLTTIAMDKGGMNVEISGKHKGRVDSTGMRDVIVKLMTYDSKGLFPELFEAYYRNLQGFPPGFPAPTAAPIAKVAPPPIEVFSPPPPPAAIDVVPPTFENPINVGPPAFETPMDVAPMKPLTTAPVGLAPTTSHQWGWGSVR